MDREWPGAFVSSSCHDLVDLRAELEPFLRDLGFVPVLSDRPSSDFEAPGDQDSISTCLVNVRKCPIFICVLSQRYGPSLGKVGFDDVSATHLEYREARKASARILFYVRDRLDAEYALWRANRENAAGLNFRWVTNSKDYGLFELIREHDDLQKDGPSNWKWPFRDSVELKARIANDLGQQSRKLLMRRMLEGGQIPVMSISPLFATGPHASLRLHNVGPVTGFELQARFAGVGDWTRLGDLPAGAHLESSLRMASPANTVLMPIAVRYRTLAGDVLEQRFEWHNENQKIWISRSGIELVE